MPLINIDLGVSGFELINSRIAEILAIELHNQSVLSSNPNIDAMVWLERFVPLDQTDMPSVIVSLLSIDNDNFKQYSKQATNRYAIDVYTSSPSVVDSDGDKLAMLKLQKIIGLISKILSHPVYNTLGFAQPFIFHTEVTSVKIAEASKNMDSESVAYGQIIFTVVCEEKVQVETPKLLEGYDTTVYIDETDKGYLYSANQTVRLRIINDGLIEFNELIQASSDESTINNETDDGIEIIEFIPNQDTDINITY